MSARVRTEVQKTATNWKRAENPAASKKASKQWYDINLAKVRAYSKQIVHTCTYTYAWSFDVDPNVRKLTFFSNDLIS